MTQQSFNAETIFEYIHQEVKRTFNIELSRRDFMKLMSGGMVGALTASLSKSKAQENSLGDAAQYTTETMPNGIASGDVTQHSVILWARSIVLGIVRFEVLDSTGSVIQQAMAEVVDTTLPVKAAISDLEAGSRYRYRVTDAANSELVGMFRTLPDVGHDRVRFGVTGDWRGELRPYPAIANVPDRNLDFFFCLGDSIYADVPSIDFPQRQARSISDFRIKHNEVYSERFGKNYWAALRASTPLFFTIGDHEVRNALAGGASPHTSQLFAGEQVDFINQTELYLNGMQVFEEFNPIRSEIYEGTNDQRIEGRPKRYRYLKVARDAAIFILDARSFRDEPVEPLINIFSQAAIENWNESIWQEGRTMLGRTQVEDLKRDLLDAHERGIIWKFVMMPEPVQQMGWFTGEDRWEGYAPERSEVLKFIDDNAIQNVVFVSADVHTTFINNLAYQIDLDSDPIQTNIWDISTGPVAYYPPTGQAIVEVASNLGVLPPYQVEEYNNGDIATKDSFVATLVNRLVSGVQGLNEIGLENTPVEVDLLEGGWLIGHTFGWTEFEIESETSVLTVTTYGIPAYSANQMSTNPYLYSHQEPQIVGQMRIQPRSV